MEQFDKLYQGCQNPKTCSRTASGEYKIRVAFLLPKMVSKRNLNNITI